MASYFYNYSLVTSGVTLTLDGFDQLFVSPAGALISTGDRGIVATGGFNSLQIDGYVGALSTSIQLGLVGGTEAGSNTLVIGSRGIVVGSTGVGLSGSGNSVMNAGEIRGNFGILGGFFDSNDPGSTLITNTGTILGADVGIVLLDAAYSSIVNTGTVASSDRTGSTSSSGTLGLLVGGIIVQGDGVSISNTGTIVGSHRSAYGIAVSGTGVQITNSGLVQTHSIEVDRAAIDSVSTDGQFVRISNTESGVILATLTAVEGGAGTEIFDNDGEVRGDVRLGAGSDTLRNSGNIKGEVMLDAGDDLYRALRDGAVSGTVDGSGGADRLVGGRWDDALAGGDDADTLIGRDGDDSLNGGAGEDTLTGGAGDDELIGDAGIDTLYGGLGDDVLRGGGYGDKLDGGRGDDVLTGGGGRDVFIFGRHAGDDIVNDFTDGLDKVNLAAFHLANFAALSGSLSAVSGGVMIDLDGIGGSGSILLSGVALGDLGGADFIF